MSYNYIPRNCAASLYNNWMAKQFPELFEKCEIAETVESCEECGFCEQKKKEQEKNDEK